MEGRGWKKEKGEGKNRRSKEEERSNGGETYEEKVESGEEK